MFDIGFLELVIIGVIGLLVLGPERLPGAIRSTSRTIRNIKNMANGFKNEIEQQVRIQELHENLKKAEQQQLKNLAPELQDSVDELKAAANSVNRPYEEPALKAEKQAQPENLDAYYAPSEAKTTEQTPNEAVPPEPTATESASQARASQVVPDPAKPN